MNMNRHKTDAECDADIDTILDMFLIKFRRELKELLLDYKQNLLKCDKGTAINNHTLIDYKQKLVNRIQTPIENTVDYKQKLVNRLQKERTEAELLEIKLNALDKRNRFYKKYSNQI